MNPVPRIAVSLALALGGCMHPEPAPRSPGKQGGAAPAVVPASDAVRQPAKPRPRRSHSDLIELPAYEIRESAFSDFGMSVRTNPEVKFGGGVEWMLVSGVAAGSSAAGVRLVPGDQILAIDARLVSELARDAMLELLFQRHRGDQARLLVLSQGDAMPRFVTLVASRPDSPPPEISGPAAAAAKK